MYRLYFTNIVDYVSLRWRMTRPDAAIESDPWPEQSRRWTVDRRGFLCVPLGRSVLNLGLQVPAKLTNSLVLLKPVKDISSQPSSKLSLVPSLRPSAWLLESSLLALLRLASIMLSLHWVRHWFNRVLLSSE